MPTNLDELFNILTVKEKLHLLTYTHTKVLHFLYLYAQQNENVFMSLQLSLNNFGDILFGGEVKKYYLVI